MPATAYDRLLLPTDGSGDTEAAVDHAVALAREFEAALDVLYVVDTSGIALDAHSQSALERREETGLATVSEVAERAREAGVDPVSEVVEVGVPHQVILDYAERAGVDLVVMGTHGRTGLDRYLLGSVTERVVRTATVPVLTVRDESVTEGLTESRG